MPSVSCPRCRYPNDETFRFCQRCGYERHTVPAAISSPLKAPVHFNLIERRKKELRDRHASTPYTRQKSSLEKELTGFLSRLTPRRNISCAIPEDVVSFLIWKDSFGKTRIHRDECRLFGDCTCPKRLAFGTVDSVIRKLRSIFSAAGKGGDDSSLPGYGNPAASKLVKEYLAAVRIEQLESRVLPSHADPFFISDLAAVAEHIGSRVNKKDFSSSQLFILTRHQAFFKTLFFAGDRAGDLGRVKTQELLYFPRKKGLLFNHVLTKTLRDGTSNLFSLKHYKRDLSLCPVKAIEIYISVSAFRYDKVICFALQRPPGRFKVDPWIRRRRRVVCLPMFRNYPWCLVTVGSFCTVCEVVARSLWRCLEWICRLLWTM